MRVICSKFHVEGDQIVKTTNGEPIPEDEPIFLIRGRYRLAVALLEDYVLNCLDGDEVQDLVFVKREGPGYPGNVGRHPGTTVQEVMRVIIARIKYCQNQIECVQNVRSLHHARAIIYELEMRAAKRHGRVLDVEFDSIEMEPTCPKCGHIGCEGRCHG